MVRVAYPWESARDADCDSDIGDNARDENGIVVIFVVNEYESNAENEPCKSRSRATRVNAAKMLEG